MYSQTDFKQAGSLVHFIFGYIDNSLFQLNEKSLRPYCRRRLVVSYPPRSSFTHLLTAAQPAAAGEQQQKKSSMLKTRLSDSFKQQRLATNHQIILPQKYSHLDESFDFQVVFEYFLFTYSDVDIWRRHVANVAGSNYGK